MTNDFEGERVTLHWSSFCVPSKIPSCGGRGGGYKFTKYPPKFASKISLLKNFWNHCVDKAYLLSPDIIFKTEDEKFSSVSLFKHFHIVCGSQVVAESEPTEGSTPTPPERCATSQSLRHQQELRKEQFEDAQKFLEVRFYTSIDFCRNGHTWSTI